MRTTLVILAAAALDLLIGDPRRRTHPVVLIGRAITIIETFLRHLFVSPRGLIFGGILLALLTVAGVYFLTWGLAVISYRVWPPLGMAAEVWLIYTALSAKDLDRHVQQVANSLQKNNLPAARRNVGMIVGRDTENLEPGAIVRAAVETVAENTVDGVISPLFYAFVGGAPLALAFKAVSTLDSMVGYRNEKYQYLGWASARLDDIANYLPARITGFLFLLVSPFTPGKFRGVWQAVRRDSRKHPSPNGGIPESAIAGALGIKIGGWNSYNGKLLYRAEMGPGINYLQTHHITDTVRLMYAVTLTALFIGGMIRGFLF